LGRQPGEIEALIAVKNNAPTHHFTKFGGSLARTVTNRTDTDPQASSNPAFITGCHSAVIDGADRGMNGITESAVDGAIFGAGVAIWLVAGLIQRFGFRNPEPHYATVFATSTAASMLLFSLVALLVFHIR
jgi:hypothetical protein